VPRRHNPTGLCGILLIDKCDGITSHDVVNSVRRITGERRVGHAGTLDPMATGLLLTLVGPATRLAPYFTVIDKTYEATVIFGSATDTDDAAGKIIQTSPVPPGAPDKAFAQEIVAALVGDTLQVPPSYSAIKRNGAAAYSMARKGEAFVMEPRPITVFAAELLAVHPEPMVAWDLRLTVSKGTYIRSIARDIGNTIGSCAHLGRLRRLKCGHLEVKDAVRIDALPKDPHAITHLFIDPVDALGLPVIRVNEQIACKISTGSRVPIEALDVNVTGPGPHVVICDERLLAIYSVSEGEFIPLTVMPAHAKFGTRQ